MLDCNASFHSLLDFMTFLLDADFPYMKDGDFKIRKERHQNNSQQQHFKNLEHLYNYKMLLACVDLIFVCVSVVSDGIFMRVLYV